MIKSLWFMVKIIALVAITVWIAGQPGEVVIEWGDYTFTILMGAFIALFIGVVFLAVTLFRIVHFIASIPAILRRRAEERARHRGLRALTIGLSAVAAGDTDQAGKQLKRVRKYWPEEKGLPDLLAAQVARLEGRQDVANGHFQDLLEHKDAAFFGVRGLLQAALERQDSSVALALGHKALKLYPKQGWVLRLVCDLEIKAQNWHAAEVLLDRAVRNGAVEEDRTQSDKVALLLLQAEQARDKGNDGKALKFAQSALKIDPDFAPAVVRAAALYTARGDRSKAAKIIEKAWKNAPHPDLVLPYLAAMPAKKVKDPIGKIKWIERLVKANPDSIESDLAAGQICIDMGLWGEARKYLGLAELKGADTRVYALFAALEEKAGSPFEEVQRWRVKAANAPPAPAWVCRVSGRTYPHWQAIVLPHGSFNSLVWGDPRSGVGTAHITHGSELMQDPGVFLDAPLKSVAS